MSNICDGIVEVRQCALSLANRLLENGYRLLAVEQLTQGVERTVPEGQPGIGANFYVAKRLEYVIGRTAEQESIIGLLTRWGDEARARREQRAAAEPSEVTA